MSSMRRSARGHERGGRGLPERGGGGPATPAPAESVGGTNPAQGTPVKNKKY
jgi:hypothetical protein